MNLKISEIPVLPGMLECQSMQERQQVHSQVSLGSHIVKPNAKKVRQLKEGVVAGFAGATADAMTLFERL